MRRPRPRRAPRARAPYTRLSCRALYRDHSDGFAAAVKCTTFASLKLAMCHAPRSPPSKRASFSSKAWTFTPLSAASAASSGVSFAGLVFFGGGASSRRDTAAACAPPLLTTSGTPQHA